MPSLPVGDVLRAFIKTGWLGRLLGALKGTSIKRGDWEIQLDEKPGATPPRTGLDQPAEFKPPKVGGGKWPLVLILAAPLLLGANGCPWPVPTPTPSPSPTVTPAPTPTPEPTATPAPTPTPGAAKCWLPLPAGARLSINAKRWGNGIDSTYWVENGAAPPEAMRSFWEAVGRPAATTAGHLEGMRDRALCEIEYARGCPVWGYKSGGEAGVCHNDTQTAAVSCDHFGNPVDRDDPQTPTTGSTLETLRGFEGEPKACGLQRDDLGPMAGFFVMPQCTPGRECSVKACLPDRSVCSDWVLVDWR